MRCEFCQKETITKLHDVRVCQDCLVILLKILNAWLLKGLVQEMDLFKSLTKKEG